MKTLIVGTTESGKTTMGANLSHEFHKEGFKVIVLTKIFDKRWYADFYTEDPDEFLEVFWASEQCVVFIDESGSTMGRYSKAMNETATQGRHWGHAIFYLLQKATQISPEVREQCSRLFLFASAPASCKALAEDFINEDLLQGSALNQGEYLEISRFKGGKKGEVTKHKIFDPIT